jgi:UDP-2-acetamido-3-amino-2,3-dideoxy-glucuronate N-acetyltransferase
MPMTQSPSLRDGSLGFFCHPSACIDDPSCIGAGTRIWHFCHVMAGARVGRDCVLGQNVFVAGGAVIRDRVRIQNNVSVFDGVTLDDDVFLGPSCTLTNVRNPRAEIRRRETYTATRIRRGATIGANATIVCGVTVGRHAFVAAGCVTTRDVPDYALWVGVPGKQKGWVGRHGEVLVRAPEIPGTVWVCPTSGYHYDEQRGSLRCLDLDEEAPIPTSAYSP